MGGKFFVCHLFPGFHSELGVKEVAVRPISYYKFSFNFLEFDMKGFFLLQFIHIY